MKIVGCDLHTAGGPLLESRPMIAWGSPLLTFFEKWPAAPPTDKGSSQPRGALRHCRHTTLFPTVLRCGAT